MNGLEALFYCFYHYQCEINGEKLKEKVWRKYE